VSLGSGDANKEVRQKLRESKEAAPKDEASPDGNVFTSFMHSITFNKFK
jgi:hypothetical protein